VASEPSSFFSQRSEVVGFLGSFFEALAKRDWDVVEASFNPMAALFTGESRIPSFLRWQVAAPLLRAWVQDAAGIRRLPVKVEDLKMLVTDKTAIISLPAKSGMRKGERVMILTLDEHRWLIRHLHLADLGIELPTPAGPQ